MSRVPLPAARARAVSEFMSRPVATVDANDELEAVINTMQRSRCHRLPVLSDGFPIGIIARHDLLRLMVSGGPLHVVGASPGV